MVLGMRFRPGQVELVYIKFKLQDYSSAITPNFKSPFQVLFNTLEVATHLKSQHGGLRHDALGAPRYGGLGPMTK
jgi:hypothetical protein